MRATAVRAFTRCTSVWGPNLGEDPTGELQALASSTLRAPSPVSRARKRSSSVFVFWNRYDRLVGDLLLHDLKLNQLVGQ
jgi:hypothetical protein